MNNPADKFTFSEIRACYSGERLAAFDALAPHFPTTQQAGGLLIDFITPIHNGGTFCSNWNLSLTEATIAIEVIKEINCDCMFIVPIPSPRGFPDDAIPAFTDVLMLCLEGINKGATFMTPYFAVHSNCVNGAKTYKQLALARVLEHPALADKIGVDIQNSSTGEMNDLFNKIGMKGYE